MSLVRLTPLMSSTVTPYFFATYSIMRSIVTLTGSPPVMRSAIEFFASSTVIGVPVSKLSAPSFFIAPST